MATTTLPDGRGVVTPSDATREWDIRDQIEAALAKLRNGTSDPQTLAVLVGALARLHLGDLSTPPDVPPAPPALFAAHTHPQGDITGLAATLAGKSDTSHTHPEFPTPGQKNALAGANGTPGTNNEYLTKQSIGQAGTAGKALAADDASTTNARTPTAHTHPWSEVTAKPATFAPSAHGHPISEIAALQAALDAKQDASTAATDTELASGLAAKANVGAVPNASYRAILEASGSHTAAKAAGTYGMGQGDPLAITGVGILYPLRTIYIAAADYPTVDGLAAKLRIRAQLYTNDVAPTGNFVIGLHPITRPATSGGAGLCIYTIGAAVAGSNGAAFNTPVADGLLNAAGADFALPPDGHYVLGVVTTATVAASAHVHISASLQMRNA